MDPLGHLGLEALDVPGQQVAEGVRDATAPALGREVVAEVRMVGTNPPAIVTVGDDADEPFQFERRKRKK